MKVTKYTLADIGSDEFALTRDGHIMLCPFRSPVLMPVQKQQSGLSIAGPPEMQFMPMPSPCSTSCPKFSIEDDNDVLDEPCVNALQKCGSETTSYLILNPEILEDATVDQKLIALK